jgi:hypothetical protein
MGPELRLNLENALEQERGKGFRVTAQATTLLTVVIESIDDDPQERVLSRPNHHNAQSKAIQKIPQAFSLASKAYGNAMDINAPMLLTVMPRVMSDFCPPFKAPPD